MKCANTRCSEYGKGCNFTSTECDYFKLPPIGMEVAKPKASKSKKDSTPRVTEDDVQAVVVEYCELFRINVVHIPNEGLRSKYYGGKLKKLGMQKGFPDLYFPKALNGHHGLYIEMKRDKNSKPTPEQLQWIKHLNKEGYLAVVCYGSDEAIKVINEYFKIKN